MSSSTASASVLESRELRKSYPGGIELFDSLNFTVSAGEILIVHGPSGCGKSTLLLMLGGMLHPSAGEVMVDGESLYARGDAARTEFRSRDVGFVFQDAHLIPYLNLEENIVAPGLANRGLGNARERARELLHAFGLEERAGHRPAALSAGERQRVALARAMLGFPKLILADEPTGNLDRENRELVMSSLREYASEGRTVVMVTHDEKTILETERTLKLKL